MSVLQEMIDANSATGKLIGYLGPEGSFSHEVAQIMLPCQRLVSFTPTGVGFRKLHSGELSAVVVPFENSIGGEVPETLDHLLLMKKNYAQIRILQQWVFKVNLCLVGRPDVSLKKLKRIYSHFVPLQVVRGWLERNFPSVETVITSSTSAAARECVHDRQALAVANKAAAQVYGLKIFRKSLVPPSKNITRFLLVGKKGSLLLKPEENRDLRRGMLHLLLMNRSGALCDALMVFKRHGVNLTQILSRPVVGSPGSYQFLVEWEEKASQPTTVWMKELNKATLRCWNLGIYSVCEVSSEQEQ